MLTGRHHGVARLEAFDNFDLARAAKPDFDLHPLRSACFSVGTRYQLDDELPPALRDDGFFRDHSRVVAHTENGIDPGKHARAKLQLPVVDTAANADRAAVGVYQWIDGLQLGGIPPAGQCIHVEQGGLAAPDLVLKSLRQTKIDVDRIDVFNVDNISTILEVVAHIDQAYAHNCVEGCNDFQARCRGLGKRKFGFGYLQVRRAFVQGTLTDEILRNQFLIALLIGLRNRQLCLALLNLRSLELVVELNQKLAFFDALAIGEIELRNAPTDFGPQHYPTP